MAPFNLRSLLLAAIFLSNCISWTASRHHYAHNVNGHRSRHRRQGAGLFLSASYVLPGGEGRGWGEWGEVSPCSRTCGGGVASQKRICLQLGPDGQPQCSGGDTKFFSCQTQDCPAGSKDFRAEQCSEYDDQLFRDIKYNWVPYTKAPNPCELNCMPHAERFYYRHKAKVIDGTRCSDDSFDVCVNGTCQPVGCDMMLGSSAKEDKCRECRGNNANCHTTSGLLDTVDQKKGYNNMLLIPEGATSIVIAEVAPSTNYLALRAKNFTFYLNGDYHIDFPRNLYIAGVMWTYERSQQGFAAPDKLRSLGPTNEPLYLSLLLQDENVGIEYEYSLPTDLAPRQNKRYNWVHNQFTPCSASCGGGFQTSTVSCRSREELELVNESLCDEGLRPPTNQSCNTDACDPQWVPGSWGKCSKQCGEGGTRSREVTCQKIISNGYPSLVAEKECFDLRGPKPELFQACNENATCPKWFTGPWKPCDKPCDEGKQTRQVVCYKNETRIEVLGDEQCEDERPADEKPCIEKLCIGVDWVLSSWKGCDSCLSTNRTRTAVCATKDHVVVNDSFCSHHPKHNSTEEACDPTTLPACQHMWYATQWGNCSVECGKGVRTRKVFCGLYDGLSVSKVDDSLCADLPKYNDTKPCEIPKEQCPSQWYAGPWSACDKDCGGGNQVRRVMCLQGEESALDCSSTNVPEPFQNCNTGPCNADELLPVDVSTSPLMDDYEDCDDEDLYPEEGLDEIGVTPGDLMYSDFSSEEGSGWTTSFAELESKFSDTDSTLSSDELITVEGSGTGSTETLSTSSDSELETTNSGSTTFTLTDDTEASESTETAETGSTETGSTTEAGSTETGSTTEDGSTNTSDTESTSINPARTTVYDYYKVTQRATFPPADDDEEYIITKSDATETGSTETTESGPTETSETTETGFTETTESGPTETSETTETGSTETTESGPTETSETTETGSTEITESGLTETTESGPTETTETTESGPTETTETTETGSTETTESGFTETSETTETGFTETTESGPTETTETTESGPTETTEITEAGSTETTESGPTETSETTETGSTETTESGPTETSETTEIGSTETTESGPTETSETTEAGSTETTESGPTETSETTESGSTETTESGPTETTETTETGSTETTESETTVASETTDTGSTETTESGPTETSETTETGSTETTESGPTETSETTETGFTETTESGPTETSETTETGSTETTESSPIETNETTETGSTETTESGPTETSETTETGSTETTESGPTETSETTETGSTKTADSGSTETTDSESTTTSAFDWITTKKPRMCRPRLCAYTKFGCCPDRKTAAGGPFDEGCPEPEPCKRTKYGCCPDGVSPAPAPKQQGCPMPACGETLFGCCRSDNKTPAEGNDQDGCPPPPPACVSSKFGCCKDGETEATGAEKEGCPETTVPETEPSSSTTAIYEGCESSEFGCCFDNATEATGPDQQGCPCDISEFGCCFDGVSPAQGPDFEGCLELTKNCNTSAYGCCPDEETPAHGPNREGCCLSSSFGCCPDNYNFARGPHLEGCGCQYSPYGCCPDNVTSASGHGHKGCDCSYSPHGCCPNGHTEASGPEFEGCACHTYQFGCCPDGVTIARGPDGQGCHCLQSKYKCCGDGETHATGPDHEGCDCSSSKYGCCPDGQTEAAGAKFQGCTDAPEDKQAACGLAFARGPCRNYSVNWYYDTEYGGCSRFWYGGCEGNGNRFATKEECDDTCVSPPPKDACKLPQSKGACFAYNIHWYYDSQRETCTNFVYGGCLGNNNNFETRELCQKQCEPEKSTEQCSLPIAQGSCAGNFSRWGFSQESRRCEQFTWGGCEGNPNRFSTEAACNLQCNPPGQPKLECSQPQDVGNCSDTEAVWSFSQTENRCVPFYYTGCGGNENRFTSLEACEDSCPSAYVPGKCTLPYETGNCASYREKWYFDTKDQRCRQFYYGGCGGNTNNFNSEQECQNECQPIPTPSTAQPTAPQPAPTQPRPPQTDRQDFCFLEKDPGPCTDFSTHWAYDYKTGRCVTFQYGGCAGNRNNFPNELYCKSYCKPSQDICQLPMLSGPCDDSQMRWFYDASTDSCSQFTYGGCEGNDNRFTSRGECESRCKNGPAAEQTTTTVATTTIVVDRGEDIPSICNIAPTLEACSPEQAGEVWYQNPATHECLAHQNLPDGGRCRTTGVFKSQEGCERSCGAFRGINVCAYPLEAGRCSSFVPKYFYNITSSRCEEFAYGGCMGGPNRFSTELECLDICKPSTDLCKQQPEPGNCLARYELWYYDENSDQCNQFIYNGCGGNDNRFESQEACEGRCKQRPGEVATTTTTTQAPAQPLECIMPDSLEPCGANETVFYYDTVSSSCRAAQFGGCRHPNSYGSEEECERHCGAFRGLDVCRAQVDPGPCRAAIPKYFFDAAEGACKEFTYGGCQGGPNRFSTIEDCEDNCKEAGPAPACLQEVAIGESCGVLPSRRWYYSPARAGCLVFAYQGCGGNENNFLSYDECTVRCNVIPTGDLCSTYSEECEALESTCETGIRVTVASEGCQRCSCEEPPNCDRQRQECDAISCSYGVKRIPGEDGCESCKCLEDPCSRANCSAGERCEVSAFRDTATQTVQYSAHCALDNEVLPECDQYEAQCAALVCRYGVQRTAAGGGCVRCACVPEEVDCTPLQEECAALICAYGVTRHRGDDGCERCKCLQHPCTDKQCPEGERCVLTPYRDSIANENRYLTECRAVSKGGYCPVDTARSTERAARPDECRDDADCRGAGKCCVRGPSRVCLLPTEPTTSQPLTTTYRPEGPQAPQVSTETEPEVTAAEGGKATLRCLFHGNPPPKITWHFGEITIDGDLNRYRLLSDGALEIVSLVHKDSGVYICVADNEHGSARQEIRLVVSDPVNGPAYIAGDADAVAVGEIGQPIEVLCRAYGYPRPDIYWFRGGLDGTMVPFSNTLFEARDHLKIRRLSSETLGLYTCYASNGQGEPVTWSVTIKGYQQSNSPPGQYLVPRDRVVVVTPRELTETTTTTTIMPEIRTPLYTEGPQAPQVSTETEPEVTAAEGGKATLRCLFHGNPPPKITWHFGEITIDGDLNRYRLLSDGALEIVSLVHKDSGVYICVADNEHGSARQEIRLVVSDPVNGPAYIAGDADAVAVGELGQPLNVPCRAYGFPRPDIYWYRGGLDGTLVPFSNILYEARDHILKIRKLSSETLGLYACYAYNGQGKPATWLVTVKGYQPDDSPPGQYLVPRDRYIVVTPREFTDTTATTTRKPEIQTPLYTVEVQTQLLPASTTISAGTELSLPCNVDGYPEPRVTWTKDGVQLAPTETMWITGTRLTIPRATISDSGVYGCHASNRYSTHSSAVQITVQEMVIPAKCTDSTYFANCALIVQGKFCRHKYYSRFCCKSCVEAGQLNPNDMQSDEPYRRK